MARISDLLQKVMEPEELVVYKPQSTGLKWIVLKVPDVDFSYQIAIGV